MRARARAHRCPEEAAHSLVNVAQHLAVREHGVVVGGWADLARAVLHAAHRVEREEERAEHEAAGELEEGKPGVQVRAVDYLQHQPPPLVHRGHGGKGAREGEESAVDSILTRLAPCRRPRASGEHRDEHEGGAVNLNPLKARPQHECGENHCTRDRALDEHDLRNAKYASARVQREQALHRVQDCHREQRMLWAAAQLIGGRVELGLRACDRCEEKQVRACNELVENYVERAHRDRHQPEARALARAKRNVYDKKERDGGITRHEGEARPQDASPAGRAEERGGNAIAPKGRGHFARSTGRADELQWADAKARRPRPTPRSPPS